MAVLTVCLSASISRNLEPRAARRRCFGRRRRGGGSHSPPCPMSGKPHSRAGCRAAAKGGTRLGRARYLGWTLLRASQGAPRAHLATRQPGRTRNVLSRGWQGSCGLGSSLYIECVTQNTHTPGPRSSVLPVFVACQELISKLKLLVYRQITHVSAAALRVSVSLSAPVSPRPTARRATPRLRPTHSVCARRSKFWGRSARPTNPPARPTPDLRLTLT